VESRQNQRSLPSFRPGASFSSRAGGFCSKSHVAQTEIGVKPDTEMSLYVGAATAAIVSLLPYVNVFILPAYIIGALTAIWHAASIRG
jgi:hypothetical protein